MLTPEIDYYFWPSSDWSYLGHDRLVDLAARAGARVNFKPVRSADLLARTGGVALPDRAENRQNYRLTELARWKRTLGSDIVLKPRHFPVDNTAALRLLANAQAAGQGIAELTRQIMSALWSHDRDIADPDVLTEAAGLAGIRADRARHWAGDSSGDTLIARNTDQAVAAGAFGAPTYVFQDNVFWGQDRLDFLARRLAEVAPQAFRPSFYGRLEGIFFTETQGLEMESVAKIRLIAGVGVENDRYATNKGYYSHKPHEDRQVTLIEQETLEALARDHDLTVQPDETRRNLLTRGVPLNHLVGRTFRVGDVVLYGGRLNVPCKYLERLLDRPVFDPLINRSGLNCRVLNTGTVRVGDAITEIS